MIEGSNPEGKVDYSPLVLNTQCEYELTYDVGAIQPSLRDLGNCEFKPGTELPGLEFEHFGLSRRD